MHIPEKMRNELEAELYAEHGESLSKRKGSHISFEEFKFYLHREEAKMRSEMRTARRQFDPKPTAYSKGTH